MKLYKDESNNKKIAKNIKFNKKIIINTTIGVIVASTIFINANAKDNKSNFEYPFRHYIENSYIQAKVDEFKRIENRKKLIKYYCENVYGLNFKIVYDLAIQLTNNFNSVEYLENLNPGYSINNKKANSIEQGIIIFTRHIYQKPQDFGLKTEDIINTQSLNTQKGNEEEQVKHYSDLFGIDPVLVLAIEYQESTYKGNKYSSRGYIEDNNPAGLINPKVGGLWKFPSPDAGIIEHIYQLKYNYIDIGLTTPEQIREKYSPSNASNDIYNLNKYWTAGVKHFINEIHKEKIFENIEQIESLKK